MLHVLLIEDNPSDVLMVREAMRKSHIAADVVIAYDGEEGAKLLHDTSFDLVILDLNIPKFSGHAILEQYRHRTGPPVVVLTGSDDPRDKESALALGAADYVVKPPAFEDFLRAVQDILERHAAFRAKGSAAGDNCNG